MQLNKKSPEIRALCGVRSKFFYSAGASFSTGISCLPVIDKYRAANDAFTHIIAGISPTNRQINPSTQMKNETIASPKTFQACPLALSSM